MGEFTHTAGTKSKSLVSHWLERKGCRRVKTKPDPTAKQPNHYKAFQKQRMRPVLGVAQPAVSSSS